MVRTRSVSSFIKIFLSFPVIISAECEDLLCPYLKSTPITLRRVRMDQDTIEVDRKSGMSSSTRSYSDLFCFLIKEHVLRHYRRSTMQNYLNTIIFLTRESKRKNGIIPIGYSNVFNVRVVVFLKLKRRNISTMIPNHEQLQSGVAMIILDSVNIPK